MLRKSTNLDLFFLSVFTILITLQPYFLYGEVNLFEFGIYLPNINAILDGLIPYRDFFHLRGPFELYVPAFFMHLFGENLAILEAYFYIGTVLTLIICVCIAKELYQTRFVLYLFTLILIGRTFPRAVFNNWGGMRYGLGLLAILFVIYFFKKRKPFMLFCAGIISCFAFLTSIEIGIGTIVSISLTFILIYWFNLLDKTITFKSFNAYLFGIFSILLPYILYLFATDSLGAYLDMTYSVVTNMTKVFPDHLFEDHPRNLLDALLGLNPFSRHFQHLTPAYCYLFLMAFIFFKNKTNTLKEMQLGIMTLGFYGLIMYISAFRKIGAAQFEMALQPEKILLFFMLEWVFLFFIAKCSILTSKVKIYGMYFIIFAFFMSSVGYSIARFNHRFFAYKYAKAKILRKDTSQLIPLVDQQAEILNLERLKGLKVPAWQAQEFKQLIRFFDAHTDRDDPETAILYISAFY